MRRERKYCEAETPCPGCGRTPMMVTAVKPLALSLPLEEHHLHCSECGLEKFEIVRSERYRRNSGLDRV